MDSFNSRWLLKALLATIDRERNIDPTPLPASETMITGPDRSRRHMIVSAMSRAPCRAAGGLRRPSESRPLPTFPLTIYLMMCGGLTSRWTCETDFSPMQRRTKDPKTMSSTAGIRGVVTSPPRRRRLNSSISSCSRNNFGRELGVKRVVRTVAAQLGKERP